MATRTTFRHQDIAVPPAGTKVRTVHAGKHELRIAFPKGARKRGSGKIVSILHPLTEKNPECGATLTMAEVAALEIPITLTSEFGPQFEDLLEPEAAAQNPLDLKGKWDALRAKVAGWIAPKAGHREQVTGDSNPQKKKGRWQLAVGSKKKRGKRNYTEQVKDYNGRTVFVDVLESGGRWMAEGYRVEGKKQKRVGRPVIAYGPSESQAYDALVEKLERNPKKKSKASNPHLNKYQKGVYKTSLEYYLGEGKNQATAHKMAIRDARYRKERPRNPAPGEGKRNLDEIEQAVELAAKFKGSPAENIREIELSNKQRDDYAHLGWVDQMVFHPPYEHDELDLSQISEDYDDLYQKKGDSIKTWREVAADHGATLLVFDMTGDEIELAASANGQQLYFLGGKQAAFAKMLDDFKTDTERDKVDLGEIVSVTYTAQKAQAGDTEPRGYYHVFGEENGTAPRAYFDMLNKRIFLTGGSYHLKEAERGIIN